MTINLNGIPSTIRTPLVYIEFDNSKAVQGTPDIMHKVLVLGQMLTTGTATAEVPVRVLSADQATSLFGQGSMLANMFSAIKTADRYIETWAIPLADAAAGAAASGTLTITGPATASGTLNVYIGGQRVRVSITIGDAATAVATALAAAITAALDLPVTAAAVDAVVTLTARHKGECGNAIDLRLNYYGETTPAGISVAIVAMSSGSANPDVADAIAAFGDELWNTFVMPWTDAANMVALETELLDRWGPLHQMDGIAYSAFRGTHGESGTWGNARNNQLVSCMATGTTPTPPWIFAAVYAVIAAGSLSIDPARPLQTLRLTGVMPPAVGDRWTKEERNLLLYDGMATYKVDSGGNVLIEREVTTYQTNSYDLPDPSYLDVQTPATLGYIRYATNARITQKFPRCKLADDGTRFSPGQAIVTPSIVHAELLVLFRELEEKGLVENFEQFKADLIVERDADDRNRLNVLAGPDLVNQFRVFAEQIQFIL
ncbi:MAG: phage tail sheath subtilisin-like domain-containing protein [Proteobacteria bacterium]|nr:phage tail sheath subtilisin-like domain-containing protein [Pseudomonadota bacterium]